MLLGDLKMLLGDLPEYEIKASFFRKGEEGLHTKDQEIEPRGDVKGGQEVTRRRHVGVENFT